MTLAILAGVIFAVVAVLVAMDHYRAKHAHR